MKNTFQFLQNMKIGVKAMLSPLLIIFLLMWIGAMAYFSLEKIEADVVVVTQDLAPDAGTAAELEDLHIRP